MFHDNLIEDTTAGMPGPYAATGSANNGWPLRLETHRILLFAFLVLQRHLRVRRDRKQIRARSFLQNFQNHRRCDLRRVPEVLGRFDENRLASAGNSNQRLLIQITPVRLTICPSTYSVECEASLKLQPAVVRAIGIGSASAGELVRQSEKRRIDVADNRSRVYVIQEVARGNRKG